MLRLSSNDITGDRLVSKANTKLYSDNYDRIFHGLHKDKQIKQGKEPIEARASSSPEGDEALECQEGC